MCLCVFLDVCTYGICSMSFSLKFLHFLFFYSFHPSPSIGAIVIFKRKEDAKIAKNSLIFEKKLDICDVTAHVSDPTPMPQSALEGLEMEGWGKISSVEGVTMCVTMCDDMCQTCHDV